MTGASSVTLSCSSFEYQRRLFMGWWMSVIDPIERDAQNGAKFDHQHSPADGFKYQLNDSFDSKANNWHWTTLNYHPVLFNY